MARAGRHQKKQKFSFFPILVFILLAIICFSGFMILRYFISAENSKAAFKDLTMQIASRPSAVLDSNASSTESIADPESTPEPEWTVDDQYGELLAQNEDMVGWLSIPGTEINFPVMHTPQEPEYYLRRNFQREYSEEGTPFLAAACAIDPASDNIIIYGHNMFSGAMFAPLVKFKDEAFYQDHKQIHFDTKAGFGTYEIIGMFITSLEDFQYHNFVNAEDAQAFADFISRVKAISYYETGVTAEYGDQLLTLSTCDNVRDKGRYVVVAKKVPEENPRDKEKR